MFFILKMATIYRLTLDELRYCIRIGTQRQETNVKNGIKSKQFTTRDPTNIHIQGVLGEYTFAQLCNRELKTSMDVTKMLDNTDSRGAKSDSFDCVVNGKKIDVKTTLSPHAKNIYARYFKRSNPADYYVLMFLTFYMKDSTDGSLKQIVPQMKFYDQLIFSVLANPDKYVVEGHFKGFVSSSNMFAQSAQVDGSHCAAVHASFDHFTFEVATFDVGVESVTK